ncbi:MAG: TonB-dependent receptor, partial [Sinobacteraceae bacterium]|nr:TonB-dependent receptor [Nevskiaceae bacterium]
MSDPGRDGRSWRGALATTVLLSLGCLASSAVWAQTAASGAKTQTYHIGAQALSTALQQFAAQSGVQLLFSESDVAGMKTAGLQGSFTKDQALQRLLAGSGLVFEFPKADAVIIRRPTSPTESTSTSAPGSAPTAQSSSGSYSTLAQSSSKGQGPDGVAGPGSHTAQAASTSDIQQVIVTGRAGVEQRTKAQTSYSVTTIDEARLRLQGPTSVTESLKSVPGFWVEASGGEASGNVRARGIPVDGFGSINLLEDGMPVQQDPALGYLNGDQAFRLDETIDRIEVVRGGPSTIFYSNAPAGAVNYIPRRVGDHDEGLLKYTVGDYGLNRIDAWYGAPIGEWKMSMGGFYRYDDGVRNPGFHGDDGGQFRVSLGREFERGKIWFDVKRLDDIVFLDLGIPMRSDSSGHLHAVPGFDGNFGTLAGPETAYIRMTTALANNVPGSTFLFDNTIGTQVKRTQASLNFDFEIADGYTLTDKARYDDTGTVRNGVYPNTLQSATSFISGLPKSLLSTYPGTAALQLRYTDSGATYDLLHQNGNGLITVGGLRGVTSPIKELMNDARLSHQFELEGTHDATLGYYVADVSQDFSRYSSTALLDVEDNARLLDLVAVDGAGNVLGSLTDHG